MQKIITRIEDISFISKTSNSNKRNFWKPIQSNNSGYDISSGAEMAHEYFNYLSNADVTVPILASIILDASNSNEFVEHNNKKLIEFISMIEIILKKYIREK